MTQTTEQLSIHLDPEQLANPDAFEASRMEAYQEDNPDARAEALDSLLLDTELKNSDGSAWESVMGQAIDQQGQPKKHPSQEGHEEAKGGYRIIIDPREAAITGIMRLTPVAEDPRITANQQRMADKIGYGPKTNDSSFRVSGR